MRKMLFAAVLAASFQAHAAADPALAPAMQGDYQAQRNVAFDFATGGFGQKLDPVKGCAWYLVVLRSDSPKLNVSDAGNVDVYCNSAHLGARGADWMQARLSAERQANALYKKIYGGAK